MNNDNNKATFTLTNFLFILTLIFVVASSISNHQLIDSSVGRLVSH